MLNEETSDNRKKVSYYKLISNKTAWALFKMINSLFKRVLFLIQNKIKTRERERILALNKIILEFLVNFFKALI